VTEGRNIDCGCLRLWVVKRIFGPRRPEVTWGYRGLHNKEHHEVYSSPNIQDAAERISRFGKLIKTKPSKIIFLKL
jgi:hypothetical protein